MEHSGWLENLPAKDLFANSKPIVTCEKNETVETILRKLATHNLYSLPVVDQTGSPMGLVDLVDLIALLVDVAGTQLGISLGQKRGTFEQFSQHFYNSTEITNIQNAFHHTAAEKVVNYSKQNSFLSLPLEGTLARDVLKNLLHGHTHRICLMDQGKVVYVVSQSTFISFFAKHVEKLGRKAQLTIEEAHAMTKPLITIPAEIRAIDAFVMLNEYRFSALAFLGEDVRCSLLFVELVGIHVVFLRALW